MLIYLFLWLHKKKKKKIQTTFAVSTLQLVIFYFICIPNICQKVDLDLIVLNNALIRNFICVLFLFFCKKTLFCYISPVSKYLTTSFIIFVILLGLNS